MDAFAAMSSAPSTLDVPKLAEHLFRHEAGKLVSVLTGIFGADRLQMAEDVVQEALVRAMQTWPYQGVPKNPAAWLMQTAKHLALDLVRREKRFHEKQPEITALVEGNAEGGEDTAAFEGEIKDQRLRLMFTCCHPLIPPESQVALALKTLCGFGTQEIAAAFLTTDAAIAKRLTRARQRIQEQRVPFEIPEGPELTSRLDGVRQVLLLLFNEGYKATSGENLVREELCTEAIRLTSLLAEHPAGNGPATHALLALMLLNAARLPARVDSDGNILRLKDQDRSRWNRGMIARGIMHLGQSAEGDEITEFHLHAGIAACHDTAVDDASTDWRQILSLYDRLVTMDDSPIIALNRAVAVAHVHGPGKGLEAIEGMPNRSELASYYLLYAVLGDFEERRGNDLLAASHFHRAKQLAELKSEQTFLAKRLQECEERLKSQPAPGRVV
ncbi:MAG TPA: sigma-70 family RNA polymerase sigma factor [Chthoniobacter sp.]|jgi:RNA polymerase sigma-70 factor (ECF subfamily)